MKLTSTSRTVRLVLVSTVVALASAGVTASAGADTICTADVCVVNQSVSTPAGPVTVSADANNVVTVHLTPTNPNTIVIGVPVQIPPGPPTLPGYTRTSVTTTVAGTVNIDTFLSPPSPLFVPNFPAIVMISIHPPGPCRVFTVGTTVTFTPINALS